MSNPMAKFKYRNHKGVIEERLVDVDAVEYIRDPGYSYQPGWFISGYCYTKKARRSFAIVNIVLNEDFEKVPPFLKLLQWDKRH